MVRLVTSVILSIALIFTTPTLPTERKVSPSQRATKSKSARLNSKPPVPYELFCPLWRTDHTFEATIRIKNELVIAPMTVVPVLFMADGTEYDLAPLTIDSADVGFVSINDALQQAPAPIQPHVSQFGSAALRFIYGWNSVSGSIQSIDRPRSLIHQYPFVRSMPMGASHQVLEGLWWKHDPGVDGFVALSNTTGTSIEVRIGLSDSRGMDGPGEHFTVAAHGTQQVQFSQLDPAQWRDERGGVTISWEGEANALTVAGGLENPGEGFSAPVVFRPSHLGNHSDTLISYASVGMMVGSPDPMMSFPSGTKFTPYAVLRNGDSNPLLVHPELYYLQGMTTIPLPVKGFTLMPRQVISLDVISLLEASSVKNYSGIVHLQFSYQGNPEALMIATGSVDQTGNYVFDVSAKGINQDRGKRISFWENRAGTDTMFTLWNPNPSPQNLLATLYFHGGTYKLSVHLDANGTSMFNISELAMAQKPDTDGHLLPRDAKVGSALVTDAKDRLNRVKIVVSVGTFNVQTATCGETCTGCDDIQEADFDQSGDVDSLGELEQWTATCTFGDGGIEDCTDYLYNWTSSNTSVATVTDYGEVSAVGEGTSNIQAQLDETITDSMCYTQGYCDYATLDPEGSLGVVFATMSQNISGPVSGDDSASSNYQAATGQTTLGPFVNISAFQGCGIGFETVATLNPSNYTGNVIIHRVIVHQGTYLNSTDTGTEKPDGYDDTSPPRYQDQNPQSGTSAGKVYDLDAPGAHPSDSNVLRYRTNFYVYAALPDGTIISPSFGYFFYVRLSCQLLGPGYVFVNDVPGDNQIGAGSTNTTWNLQ